jgi:hypothetical protein
VAWLWFFLENSEHPMGLQGNKSYELCPRSSKTNKPDLHESIVVITVRNPDV